MLKVAEKKYFCQFAKRCGMAFVYFIVTILVLAHKVSANEIELPTFEQGTLGQYIQYFQENNQALTLEQAQQRFANGQTNTSSSDSISLGIGVDPVWLKFELDNLSTAAIEYRLAVETPWLDNIDTWLIHDKTVTRQVKGGDAVPFENRPMQYRHYAFEHAYLPGKTDVLVRVESLGPMAIPVRLSTTEKAINRDISSAYQYGFLYGIMSALALYNLVLYVYIRQNVYGLYGLYLLGFVVNSLSYTGQLHTVITSDFGAYFQDWLDIFLMITYSVAGLHFARALLATRDYAPTLDKVVIGITLVIPIGMLIGFIFNQLVFSISLAFILNSGFVTLFIAMGFYAVRVQKPFALIFLVSSVTAALCITISSLAVAGILVPYNDYTFKAIEVGMTFEAILLAVILARQFRMAQLDKVIAQSYARTDSLTNLNNRHGFQEVTSPIWQQVVRQKRQASIVLLDIDNFKNINDSYGHSAGDKALQRVAQIVIDTARKGDVSGRWGGEEFILFLPETSPEQAVIQAERLREAIEKCTILADEFAITLTASFGVAGTLHSKVDPAKPTEDYFEVIINNADVALYRAKNQGKNQVQLKV